jgi:hypothetical protein
MFSAEKALVCFPGIGSIFQKFQLLPVSSPPTTKPHSQIQLRLLRGLPANLGICAVYDLIRPWGCLSTLSEGSSGNGRRDWSLGFIKEEDAKSWEQECSGITFKGQIL